MKSGIRDLKDVSDHKSRRTLGGVSVKTDFRNPFSTFNDHFYTRHMAIFHHSGTKWIRFKLKKVLGK
jgi:hypothetical protein